MIQLCDQFPNFVALIGNKHIASVDLSIKPSAKIFSSISEKITLEVNKENAKAQEALQRAHEIEINALQAVFEEKTIEADLLQRKIRELETKISEVRTEKSLAQDTVIRQARIDVITMLAEVIDEIRVILEEMEKIDDSTIENLYRSSLRKIGKVDVQVIFPSDKSRSSDPNLFASQESASFGGTFLGRPAYVYIIGGKEYVLRRGVVIKSR
jgi:molecular chaperone GrpE (heat shock protein)